MLRTGRKPGTNKTAGLSVLKTMPHDEQVNHVGLMLISGFPIPVVAAFIKELGLENEADGRFRDRAVVRLYTEASQGEYLNAVLLLELLGFGPKTVIAISPLLRKGAGQYRSSHKHEDAAIIEECLIRAGIDVTPDAATATARQTGQRPALLSRLLRPLRRIPPVSRS